MKRKKIKNLIIILILTIISAIILYPIGVLLYASARGSAATAGLPEQDRTFIENYKIVLQDERLPRFFINSIVIATSTTALTLFVGSLSAFALSKLKFKFRNLILNTLLLGIMIPAGIIMVPLFLLMKEINLISNPLSVILIQSGLFTPYAILVLRNYIDDLPYTIIDAASIDGCSKWSLYQKIVLPLAKPALIAVGIFVFLWSWNDYLIPLVFLRRPEMQTVQLAPEFYKSYFFADIPLYFASMVVIVIPVIVIYFIFQNKFIEGLTAGSLKE